MIRFIALTTLEDIKNNLASPSHKSTNSVTCEPCKGSGVAKHSITLGWGMSTPTLWCRHCFGEGLVSSEQHNK